LNINDKSIQNVNDFKAIIKTSKNDTISILPATILIRQQGWYYLEVNIDLTQIRDYGALNPIYSTNKNNRIVIFQEDIVKPKEKQDHIFMAFGIFVVD